MIKCKGYTCSCCGQYQQELPTSYISTAPVYFDEATSEEQQEGFELNDNFCIMDKEHFFIRGCIEIPIIGTDEHLIWGVWVSLSEDNFNKTKKYWNNQEVLEPMFGWLSTDLLCYPDTVNLKARVYPRPNGVSPYVELEPTDHPLAVEYRNGVNLKRLQEIAEELCTNSDNE